MHDPLSFANLLGFAAGGLTTASALPQIIANIRRPVLATGQSVWRNLLVLAGNATWVWWGGLTMSTPVICFCSLTALLTLVLIAQQGRLVTTQFRKTGAVASKCTPTEGDQ